MLHARRNLVSEMVESAAKLPWWGGIVLAFLGFVMLHPFAIMDVAAAAPMDDHPAITSKAFWRGLADTIQYVVPAVLLVTPFLASLVNRILKGRGA
jgi:hypothetical protein